MSTKLKKFLDVDVKAAEDGSGAYWFTASTQSRDRQGDIIVQNGWKTSDFMKNPVILWAHNYYETPIGKATEMKMSSDSISAKIQFVPESIDPFAAKVEKLVANGYLKTVSVGFTVYKSEPLNAEDLMQRPELKYGQRLYGDLLEISIVPVPANPEALNENAFGDVISRGFGLKVDEARSKLLPYQDEKGIVSPRLLRASIAVALGARGGIRINDAKPEACLNHLHRIAKENNINVTVDPAASLQDNFRDVWHEEVLDIIQNADKECETGEFKLISGKRRADLIKARDVLNEVLAYSAEEIAITDQADEMKSLAGIVKNLSDINARLH